MYMCFMKACCVFFQANADDCHDCKVPCIEFGPLRVERVME